LKLKNNNVCIWFTGLSASGKSTLSELLYSDMKDRGISNIILLDGEAVREQLKFEGFGNADRNEVGIQKSKIALDYINRNNHVIITGIAHIKDTRDRIRKTFKNYYEIYLKCDVSICSNRDYKGHYIKAKNGEISNFVGITEDYQESSPELVVDTGKMSIKDCQGKILKSIIEYIEIIKKRNKV
tara:strand:- start:230 stop:781 length:552 start_codon:yes stop_codon:yes gene_type:complete